ncbi:hypothetical protein, partial [Streptomyces sp. NPDC048551]|uniref:hypothetical protein n=1 Tax=Streptomyces sp. NPDC048551 TaxID=3155758 RepID=UPI003435A796
MDADGTPDEVVDALYADPPDGFTAARDAAVARAKADGDTATAKRVAGLRRPTLAAWVSNTLVRAQPEEVELFLQLGQALREAHRSLDGEQLRELSHQQHVVVGALAREAQRLAGEAGTAVSEPVVREVERILYTALADPDAATAWASARLTRAPAEAASFPQADHLIPPQPAPGPGAGRRAGRPPVHPAVSEAGRLLCAGTYLDAAYRDRVIDELFVHEERIAAPSYGFDASRVLAHALRARRVELAWAAGVLGAWFAGSLLTGGLLALLLFPFLML